MASLQDLCLLTVSSYLSPSNVWPIHRLVPYVHCTRIEHIVHSFICDNFMAISHTDQFLALDEKEIHWLLDNQDIKVSEAAMLDSLARWYKHDERQRENAFKQLFDKVHFSIIDKDVLSAMIKKYQLVKVIPGLRKYKKLLPQRMNLDDLIFQENISNIAVMFGYDLFFPTSLVKNVGVLHYWLPLASKFLVTECPALGFLDCHEDEDIFEKKVPFGNNEVFILVKAVTTVSLSNIPEIHQTFYLRFNSILRSFKVCTPFFDSGALNDYISVPCSHFIFFIRGVKWPDSAEDQVPPYKAVYRYDTTRDHWQEVKPTIMTHSSQKDCAVSFKNRYLYVFGINSSEMYDLATNTWTLLETPWQGRVGTYPDLHAATLGDCLCVWLKITIHTVFQSFAYDPQTKIWESVRQQQCHHKTTETLFGKLFSIHHTKPQTCVRTFCRKPMLYLSLLSNDLVEQKRLVYIEKGFDFWMDYFHMTILSRGTRLAIELDKNVQHIKK